MNTQLFFAFLAALFAGMAIGGQGTMINLSGQLIGMFRAGFGIHLAGALVGGVIVFALVASGRETLSAGVDGRLLAYMGLAGIFGMIIVPSIAYALPQTGLVAGQGAIILGQMAVALLIDMMGVSGDPIPLDSRRVLGLLILGLGVYFLLPPASIG